MAMDIIRIVPIVEASSFSDYGKQMLHYSLRQGIACVDCSQALWQEVNDGDSSEFIVVCEKIGKISATLTESKHSYPTKCYFIDPKKEEVKPEEPDSNLNIE